MNSIAPTASLQPYIKAFLIIESKEELFNRVLPDTVMAMAFRYKGAVEYLHDQSNNKLPLSVISGLRKSARLIHYTKDSGNIIVQFKEGAATAFFRHPLHELFDASVSLDNLFDCTSLFSAEQQIAEAKTTSQKIAIIEQFLLARLKDHKADTLILAATERIRLTKGLLRIKDLACHFNISQDAFEKRFRRVIGATPKQYSSTIRMKSLIAHGLQEGSFMDLAFEAGYFDQPHFNKDFRLFTGQTPGDFFKSPSFW